MIGKAINAEPVQKVEEYPSPFLESPGRETLEVMWQIREVNLIDAVLADKTPNKRHRFVFTKLRAFEVPYRKIIFFDLDIIVRRSPRELFKVEAPAGMYHGRWDRKDVRHGEILPRVAFHDGIRVRGCVNAGLMRLDPLGSKAERMEQIDVLVRKVSELTEKDQSYLPEQYFLVKELPRWHHIDVAWNCEVNPEWFVDAKSDAEPKVLRTEMPEDWWQLGADDKGADRIFRENGFCGQGAKSNVEQLSETVRIFHFSGNSLQPWWYIHLQPGEAFTLIQKQFAFRDGRCMVALAVADWLSALQDLRACALFQRKQATYLQNIIYELARYSSSWWESARQCGNGCTCCKDETICEECFVKAQGLPKKKKSCEVGRGPCG